ncbi:hypothetical protein [Paraburkholderia sp. J8-2]|uniref:hypothetical protein n=1 Tax=Paraburkholderia sp. J8-2 TaxID=2805440 RepID=UPI002AB62E1B|nr:hypothetical protein [Paraburkholderia sp. J8-2]
MNWSNLPLRADDVTRKGRGRGKGRFGLWACVNLIFWGVVARQAMKMGRIVIVTGAPDAGTNWVLSFLPGKALGPDGVKTGEKAYEPAAKDLEGTHPLKFVGPRSFEPHALRSILSHLGSTGRAFSIATGARHAEWLRRELDLYARGEKARGVFWLTLE